MSARQWFGVGHRLAVGAASLVGMTAVEPRFEQRCD